MNPEEEAAMFRQSERVRDLRIACHNNLSSRKELERAIQELHDIRKDVLRRVGRRITMSNENA